MTEKLTSISFLEHIEELRGRLLRAMIALLLGTALSFYLGDRLLKLLLVPIGGMENVQSIEVTENVSVFMRVSLLSGFIIAFPFILYQLLAFILPGLTKSERRWVIIAIPVASILFILGVVFAYLVMIPAAIPFLVGFLGIPSVPRISNYIKFITNLIFWIGVSFEMPLLFFILAKLKLVTSKMLAKQWRIAVVVIAILAAVISPTIDPINMGLLMAPLLLLYVLSILMAAIAGRGRNNK
jgi:sec-independent protein translocase protein TatC